ncbi:MAG: D-alanine--D-alanine ligase [Bacteroidia bacterium]
MSSTIALMFGGQSPEHEISVRSARNIFAAIDQSKYHVVLIGVSPSGTWHHFPLDVFQDASFTVVKGGRQIAVVPGERFGQLIYCDGSGQLPHVDVVFPILHGPYGEDGTLQGILRHISLPFVGPDVLGSAVSMDKDVAKRLLREADLLTAEFFCFHYYEKEAIDYAAVVNKLGLPLFIKPANMGSSVGVKKVENQQEFEAAVKNAFRYDHKIIVEEAVFGRELECAVMGNGEIASTGVGEVGMSAGFYDYNSKYVSADAAKVMIPAPDVDNVTLAKLVLVAKNAYRALCCEGMSRVDMFLTDDGQVYVNEINTLPGFTNISMYPQLWQHQGTSYPELIDALIQLAFERGKREESLEKQGRD